MMGIEYSKSPVNPKTGKVNADCAVKLTDDSNPARSMELPKNLTPEETAAEIGRFFTT